MGYRVDETDPTQENKTIFVTCRLVVQTVVAAEGMWEKYPKRARNETRAGGLHNLLWLSLDDPIQNPESRIEHSIGHALVPSSKYLFGFGSDA